MSTCKSCGAPVFFAKHAITGRPMILDAEPRDDGNIMVHEGKARVLAGRLENEIYADRDRYVTHFATCPNAKEHRRPK